MAKNKLEYLKEEYEKNPKDNNLLRYISCLITYRYYDEALELLNKVTDTTKINVVSLYRARIYRFKNEENQFLECINSLLETDIAYEAYIELAEYNLTKLVKLKKRIKTKTIERTSEIEKEINNLNTNIRNYIDESLKIKKSSIALLKKAEIEFFEENYDEAEKYFKEILANKELKIQLKDFYYVRLRLATIYVNNNDLDSAETLIDQILKDKYPNKNQVILLKAQILMKKGNLFEAKEYFKKGLSEKSSPADYLEYAKLCINLTLYDEAMIYLNIVKGTYIKNRAIQEEAKLKISLGEYEIGIELYKEMLKGNNKDKNIAYIGIGTAYRIKEEYKDAIDWLNKALNGTQLDKLLAKIELAKVYEDLNDFTIAKKLLDEVIEISDGKYGKLEYAKLLIKTHDNEQATNILLNVIEEDINQNDKHEALMILAITEKSIGNLNVAKNYLKQILDKKNKIYYKALCIEIECNIELREFELAQNNIELLKESQSKIDKEKTLFYEAELLRAKGKNLEAEEKYLNLLNNNNYNILALNGLANLYKDIQDLRFFDITNKLRTISKNNEYMASYLEGSYYMSSGELKKALEVLKINIDTTNDYSEISIILCAEIFELCDDYNKAFEYYLSINNNSKLYNKALFKMAKIYLKCGELEKSEQYFNQLINADGPYKNLAEINIAIILSEKKEYNLAYEILQKFKGTKHDSYAKLELGKIKVKENKLEEACQIFESIIDSSSRFHALLELVKAKCKLQEYYQANMYADILIEENNGHLKQIAMIEKARIYSAIGNYKRAKMVYLNLLNELNEDNYDSRFKNNILLDLGQTEKELGNIDEAINYFLQINTSKEKAYAYCELIDIEIERKDFAKAMEYINYTENSFLADRIKTKKISIYLELGEFDKIPGICEEITSDEYQNIATYRNALAYFGEENFTEAKKLFLTLIQDENEFNELSKIYLGKISVIEKDLENAKKYFDVSENYNYSKLRQLMFIDIKEQKYYEALQKAMILFDASNSVHEKEKVSILISYISYKLNILLPEKYYDKIATLKSCAIEYDKALAYDFLISKSLKDEIFNPNVDFDLLLDIVETKLDDNHFTKNEGYDEYVFQFNNIGINGENYLKVCTLPNTKNIIAMYPIKSKYDFHNEYVRKKARNEK